MTHATLVELALAGARRPDRRSSSRSRSAAALFGVVADRLAVRWPEHDEEHPGRPADRLADGRDRAAIGAFAFGLLAAGSRRRRSLVQALFGRGSRRLVVGFAIDLDQRLLPDELTLPVIPLALLLDVTGRNPLVGDGRCSPAIVVAVVVPVGAVPRVDPVRGRARSGWATSKLLVGVGLMAGLPAGVHAGSLAGLLAAGPRPGVLLLATRRIGRRTYVPFGPFLIFGALWGIFVSPEARRRRRAPDVRRCGPVGSVRDVRGTIVRVAECYEAG